MDALQIYTTVIGTFIYVAGFIGNFLAFLIFIQKELRQVSTGLLFLLLNIANSIHLLTLIFEFIDSLYDFPVFPSAVFRCQFLLWLQNSSRTVCSFLATTISIDRFIRSEYPVLTRKWCTPRNVFKLSIVYCLFSVLLYAFFFYPLNLLDDIGFCSYDRNHIFRLFALYLLPPIRFALICVIPASIMVVCGCRMLYNIKKSRQRVFQKRLPPETILAAIVIPISKVTTMCNSDRQQNVAVDRTLVLMVMMNVVAYITTQVPFNSYSVYYGYEETKDNFSYSKTRSYLLMWSSVYFGVGFYLFCCASRQFRKQFLTRFKIIGIYRTTPPRQLPPIRHN